MPEMLFRQPPELSIEVEAPDGLDEIGRSRGPSVVECSAILIGFREDGAHSFFEGLPWGWCFR